MNTSPPLDWSGVPAGTKSLLLICNDPDAPGSTFHHWAVYNISPEQRGFEEGCTVGMYDERFGQAVNDFGRASYSPVSSRGHKPHA